VRREVERFDCSLTYCESAYYVPDKDDWFTAYCDFGIQIFQSAHYALLEKEAIKTLINEKSFFYKFFRKEDRGVRCCFVFRASKLTEVVPLFNSNNNILFLKDELETFREKLIEGIELKKKTSKISPINIIRYFLGNPERFHYISSKPLKKDYINDSAKSPLFHRSLVYYHSPPIGGTFGYYRLGFSRHAPAKRMLLSKPVMNQYIKQKKLLYILFSIRNLDEPCSIGCIFFIKEGVSMILDLFKKKHFVNGQTEFMQKISRLSSKSPNQRLVSLFLKNPQTGQEEFRLKKRSSASLNNDNSEEPARKKRRLLRSERECKYDDGGLGAQAMNEEETDGDTDEDTLSHCSQFY